MTRKKRPTCPAIDGEQGPGVELPLYAHYGVAYAWLVDPKRRTLEAFALDAGAWRLLAQAFGTDTIAVAPFDALGLDLSNLWS